MKEAWIPERRETKRSEKTSTGFLNRLKENPALRQISQKYAVRVAVLLAIAFPGCSIFDNQEPTPTMTPSPTPAVFHLQEGMPSTTIKPTETPIPIPTETPALKPKVISLGSFVETDSANPSVETIKLLFPEGIVNGKSPLIPEGDTLFVSLKLNSDARINQLSLSLSDLLGIKNNKFSMGMSAANERDTADIASAISIFQHIAKFSIKDADQEIINKITLTSVRDSNKVLVVNLSLPNKPLTYTDKDGSHFVNPAERFASGKVGIGINRKDRLALTVETKIANDKGELVARANGFDITPHPTRTIPTETPIPSPTSTKTPEPPPTPKPTPTPTPPPTPMPTATPTPLPTPIPAEVQNYVKPGQRLVYLDRVIDNPSSVSKLRSIDLEFQGGDETKSVKTQISKIPLGSGQEFSEGTVFVVPPGGMVVKIIVDVPPGASPGCFEDIIFSLRTEEPGTNRGEIERASLAKKACVEESLRTYFSDDAYYPYYDEGKKRVVFKMVLANSAVEQIAKLEIANCAFKVAEKEAEREVKGGLERLDLNDSIAFPANTQRTYIVSLTPEVDKAGKKPSEPFGCTVKPLREFDKQTPKAK